MKNPFETRHAVRVSRATKAFGEGAARVKALAGADLDVREGELMMLVGPSGCGKTTLISVLAGILVPDEGEVELAGRDLRTLTDAQRTSFRSRNVGFVFQSFNLIPTVTLAENVAVPLLVNGMNRREAVDRGAAMLAKVGLGDRTDALPAQLSGGQQQRVAIARALVHGPGLIVADEPTSALDAATGKRVMELFREVALADNRTLVIVTHDTRIFGYADRIARMDDGRVTSIEDGVESQATQRLASSGAERLSDTARVRRGA